VALSAPLSSLWMAIIFNSSRPAKRRGGFLARAKTVRSINAPMACNGHNSFVVNSSKPESRVTARNGKRRNNDFGRTPRRKR
jgi:hypothetical protein